MKSIKQKLMRKQRGQPNINDVTLVSSNRRSSNQIETTECKVKISQQNERKEKLKQLSFKSPLPDKMTSPIKETAVTSFTSKTPLKSMTSVNSASSLNDSTFSFGDSMTSLSIRDSPTSSMLSLSMTSNEFREAKAKMASPNDVTNSNKVQSEMTKKKTNIFKFPFRKSKIPEVKRRSSTADVREVDRSRSGRSNSMVPYSGELMEQMLEDNQSLRIEVQGKDEELRMLNATIDQSNLTWEAKVLKLQHDVEEERRRNEKLMSLVQQSQQQTSKPPIRVPVNPIRSSLSSPDVIATGSDGATPPTKRHGVREVPPRKQVIPMKFEKTAEVRDKLLDAVSSSKCLSQLPHDDVIKLIDVMKYKRITKGERLMQEGTRGLAFYVLAEGECSMFKQSMESCGRSVSLWEVFGDVDLFYHSPRVWSCKCVRQGAVWFVTREEFGEVVKQHDNYSRKREVFNFLKSIPTFQKIDRPQLKQIVQSSKLQHFGQGDYVINQGSLVSFVYVIKEGEVRVTRLVDGTETLQHVLRKGQWFGSVTGLQRHQNNVIAAGSETLQCVVVPSNELEGVNSFMTSSNDGVTDINVGASLVRRVLDPDGSGSEITKSSSGYGSEGNSPVTRRRFTKRGYDVTHKQNFAAVVKRLAGMNLEDFNVVATIGNGAFGSVDLVALASDNSTAFAVKKMSNDNIISADQQHHVTNEMNIQSMTSQECPFIVSLYTTFKDNRNIYFVMEFCPGGELFTLLTSAKSFDLNASRFYTACVVEALSFLHSGGVVFRDLKPENLVLDRQGYCKLTDFGFAKKLSNRSHLKTYTFCGTPECMAPEILLYQAHSFPVDLWALGVFIFELVVGKAPFRNKNKDELGQSILRGIEPKLKNAKEANRIDDVTMNIVEQLCQLRANERLGAGGKGLSEVTNHPWFNGFKWELLRQRKLVAPWRPSINSSTDVRYFHSCTKHQSPIKGNFPGFDASF